MVRVHHCPPGQHSSVVEHWFCKPTVVGSIPTAGSIFLDSSMVEHSAVNRTVPGSSPGLGAILYYDQLDSNLLVSVCNRYTVHLLSEGCTKRRSIQSQPMDNCDFYCILCSCDTLYNRPYIDDTCCTRSFFWYVCRYKI